MTSFMQLLQKEKVSAVNMFPQTNHVEVVGVYDKSKEVKT